MKVVSNKLKLPLIGIVGNLEYTLTSSNEDTLYWWLSSDFDYYDNIEFEEVSSIINSELSEMMIVRNLNVYPKYQNKGYGSKALREEIKKCNVDGVLLLADIKSEQKEGFILEDFYKHQGFETIFVQDGYPLMVFPKSKALKIKEKLSLFIKN